MLNKENIILVTGATGSQGGAVATALLKSGNAVRVIVRGSSRHSQTAVKLEKASAEIFMADMEDRASLETALQGVYGVASYISAQYDFHKFDLQMKVISGLRRLLT